MAQAGYLDVEETERDVAMPGRRMKILVAVVVLGLAAAELFFFVERRQRGTVEVSGVSGDGGPAVASVPVLLVPA